MADHYSFLADDGTIFVVVDDKTLTSTLANGTVVQCAIADARVVEQTSSCDLLDVVQLKALLAARAAARPTWLCYWQTFLRRQYLTLYVSSDVDGIEWVLKPID